MINKQSLIKKIESSDLMDALIFKEIIKEAIENSLISDKELSEEFEVHSSTIKRWVSGIAVPLPRFRKLILLFIKSNI